VCRLEIRALPLLALALLPFAPALAQSPPLQAAWTVSLSASTDVPGAAVDPPLTIGTAVGASDGWQAGEDLLRLPTATVQYIRLVSYHSASEPGWERHAGSYGVDLHATLSPGGSTVWPAIRLVTDLGTSAAPARVTLSWSGLDALPSYIKLTLSDPDDVDGDGVRQYDMRARPSIPVAARADGAVKVFSLSIQATDTRAAASIAITGATVSPTSPTTALAKWTTNVPATSVVHYGTDANLSQQQTATGIGTLHSVELTGLTPATTYLARVESSADGLPTATSGTLQFATPPLLAWASAPVVESVQPNSAVISFSTNEPTSATVQYGTTTAYGSAVNDQAFATSHRVTVTGLTTGVTYHANVIASTADGRSISSTDLLFTTQAAVTRYQVGRKLVITDAANDNTGRITDQDARLRGRTVGEGKGIAYDAPRGLLYVARGNLLTEDGRDFGHRGIAVAKLQPLSRSANPSAPQAASAYTDTGLLVAPRNPDGSGGLGYAEGVVYDPGSDAVYVLAGAPGGTVSATPTVYRAPGGSAGGSPNGGNTSAESSALAPIFMVTNDAGPGGAPLGGTNRGLAVTTVQGVTWVYLAMGQHADVWSNRGGRWHREWASTLFPADDRANAPLPADSPAVCAVAVDPEGYSYWCVRGSGPMRLWVFPPGLSGPGQGFDDTALGGSSKGAARPLMISNPSVVAPAALSAPTSIWCLGAGPRRTLIVSCLGVGAAWPTVARLSVTADSSGRPTSATVVDAFGKGAPLSGQDPQLSTLAVRSWGLGGQKATRPAGPQGALVPICPTPDGSALWVNGYFAESPDAAPSPALVLVSAPTLPASSG